MSHEKSIDKYRKPLGLKYSIKRKLNRVGSKIKRGISNSFVGRSYRAVKSTIRTGVNLVKKPFVLASRVGKAFLKASKFTGKVALSAMLGVWAGMKWIGRKAKEDIEDIGRGRGKKAFGTNSIKRGQRTLGKVSNIFKPRGLVASIS